MLDPYSPTSQQIQPPPSTPPPVPRPRGGGAKLLFSDHYLRHRLPEHLEWDEDVAGPFERLRALYAAKQGILPTLNEAQIEAEFIRPSLEILGFAYIVQTPTRRAGRVQRPDYALFADEDTKEEAYPFQREEPAAFYARALAIADAKYWERPLSETRRDDARDTFHNTNPLFQIVNYLTGTGVDWGILTNGRLWRLHYRQASSTATEFYEVDLVEALESGDLEQFKYFWLFFRRDAFIPDAQGNTFLDRVRMGSDTYARVIGGRLKGLVFGEVFPLLAGGFVAYRQMELGEDVTSETACQDIYQATLSLLYKLLFLLYAEARDLLPVANAGYRQKSVTRMAREIARRMDRREPLGITSTELYDRLLDLFRVIDRGDRGLALPCYNGGLFSAMNRANQFLARHKLADAVLAPALDKLARADGEPVDYGYIGVRHLGAIYEGLLEYRLAVDDAASGQVHLETDKEERRTTGSYYTPDYVVKYIVRHTLGPILEERRQRFEDLVGRIAEVRRKLADGRRSATIPILREELDRLEHQARETLLDIKVCDPAMGSGHFLVEAVDFLTDRLINVLNRYPEHNPVLSMLDRIRASIVAEMERQGIAIDPRRLDDTQLLTRVVMKRCIYGVDLNEMAVELAKVSLWLHTFTVGAPLSFLDHHLRWGNSLIGAMAHDVDREMQQPSAGQLHLFAGAFRGLLRQAKVMRGISVLSDATFAELEKSETLFQQFDAAAEPYKKLLDVYMAQYFGVKHANAFLRFYGAEVMEADPDSVGEPYATVVREARRLYEEKRFFHWDLEFPEVFIDLGKADWKESLGFDAVVGNPPYQRIQTIQLTDPRQAKYFETRFEAATGKYDIYVLFIEQALNITSHDGGVGMILPHKFTQAHFGYGIRGYLHERKLPNRICSFGTNQVFTDATTYTCLLFLRGGEEDNWRYYEMPYVDSNAQLMRDLLYAITDEDMALLPRSAYSSSSWVLGSVESAAVLGKMQASGQELAELVDGIFQGVVTGLNDVFILEARAPRPATDHVRLFSPQLDQEVEIEAGILRPFTKGEDISRYRHVESTRFILYPYEAVGHKVRLYSEDEIRAIFPLAHNYLLKNREDLEQRGSKRMSYKAWYALWNPRTPQRFVHPKILAPDICYHGQMTVSLDKDLLHADTTYAIMPRRGLEYDIYALLAILNSQLLWFFLTKVGTPLRGGYYRYKTKYLERFPIRRIAFTTLQREHKRLMRGGIIEATEWIEGAEVSSVASMSFSAFSDSPFGKWVSARLEADPEQSDVVHDLLAYLAEQMIEMNKQNQAEVKSYLVWLEREIGVPIDNLTRKTYLRNYLGDYQKGEPHLTLEELLDILRRNRRRLEVNPTTRDFQEQLEREYRDSLDKLLPLKARLATTDRLIDLIVYRLYGLTEEEVAVVEGAR